MNSISFSFWSGSRCSVKSTRRNVFQRASKAAIEEATPTFNNKVNSNSPQFGGRIHRLVRRSAYASQTARRCKPSLLEVTKRIPRREAIRVYSGCRRFRTVPAIIKDSYEEKIVHQGEGRGKRRHSHGRARGLANALRQVHHLRLHWERAAGGSGRPGARKSQGPHRPAGARPLSMPLPETCSLRSVAIAARSSSFP